MSTEAERKAAEASDGALESMRAERSGANPAKPVSIIVREQAERRAARDAERQREMDEREEANSGPDGLGEEHWR